MRAPCLSNISLKIVKNFNKIKTNLLKKLTASYVCFNLILTYQKQFLQRKVKNRRKRFSNKIADIGAHQWNLAPVDQSMIKCYS